MTIKPASQRGAAAVEFALICTAFLALLFALFEYGRMLFLWNALPEVTRRAARAAAVTDFSDADAMQALRQTALLGSGGALPLAANVTGNSLRIEYLWQDAAGNRLALPILPNCPTANRINCASNPHGTGCIRFVRVSLCDSAAAGCPDLDFQPMMPMLLGSILPDKLPRAAVTVPAESLGYMPGQAPCP